MNFKRLLGQEERSFTTLYVSAFRSHHYSCGYNRISRKFIMSIEDFGALRGGVGFPGIEEQSPSRGNGRTPKRLPAGSRTSQILLMGRFRRVDLMFWLYSTVTYFTQRRAVHLRYGTTSCGNVE